MSVLPFRPKRSPELSANDLFVRACGIDDLNPGEGMFLYQCALRLDPKHDLSMSNLARLYFQREEYGAAEMWWMRAIEANPKQPEAYYNLGYLRAVQGAYTSAVEFFSATLVLDEKFADAHFNLADTLERLGLREDARPHWRRYVQLGGPFAKEAMAALGMRVVE